MRGRIIAFRIISVKIIGRLPDKLAVAKFAGKVKVFSKVKRIAIDTRNDLSTDFVQTFRLALASRIYRL